jgi:hypothetical protein
LGRRPAAVHLVTEARTSRYDDIAARQRQYVKRMFIRTVAVIVAFFVPLPIWGRVLAVALGLVLPMISVTSANVGPLPEPGMDRYDVRALQAGSDVPSTQDIQRQPVIDLEPDSRAR